MDGMIQPPPSCQQPRRGSYRVNNLKPRKKEISIQNNKIDKYFSKYQDRQNSQNSAKSHIIKSKIEISTSEGQKSESSILRDSKGINQNLGESDNLCDRSRIFIYPSKSTDQIVVSKQLTQKFNPLITSTDEDVRK